MSLAIAGIVKNGVIIPSDPLPEGAHVEIHLSSELEVGPELQDELAAWQQASANALALVERMALEDESHEKR